MWVRLCPPTLVDRWVAAVLGDLGWIGCVSRPPLERPAWSGRPGMPGVAVGVWGGLRAERVDGLGPGPGG